MALIEWKKEFSVKIKKIDEQHKQLIDMLNEFNELLIEDQELASRKILVNMAKYAIGHFKTEEKLFLLHKYPHYLEHKQEHDKFIVKLQSFQIQFRTGKRINSREIIDFLKNWLLEHILKTDKQYSGYLHSKGVY